VVEVEDKTEIVHRRLAARNCRAWARQEKKKGRKRCFRERGRRPRAALDDSGAERIGGLLCRTIALVLDAVRSRSSSPFYAGCLKDHGADSLRRGAKLSLGSESVGKAKGDESGRQRPGEKSHPDHHSLSSRGAERRQPRRVCPRSGLEEKAVETGRRRAGNCAAKAAQLMPPAWAWQDSGILADFRISLQPVLLNDLRLEYLCLTSDKQL